MLDWQPRVMIRNAEKLGATYLGSSRTRFLVWAPYASQVELHVLAPVEQRVPMQKLERSYFRVVASPVEPGSRYLYRFNGKELPDPASRYQPEGVHGPSEVTADTFEWQDQNWVGFPLSEYIIYELHVGTFTAEGTFEAIIPYLDKLRELGITAIELLPLAQFPGTRNWGYDGVFPFAPQNSYGGPLGLKKLVNTCHQRGLAVILDEVYNHFGPEGNYLPEFGPYLTDRYKTPWGPAMNFDGPESDEVRRFFLVNARMWQEDFHVDGLRLDAGDYIFDFRAHTFLEELSAQTDELEQRVPRSLHLMIENDLNSPRYVRSRESGGYGLDAQWTDDFHHALHTLLTGDISSYYIDFKTDPGQPLAHLAQTLRQAYVYAGEYSVYRHHRRGVSPRAVPADHFIVFSQNHDQVGNRMLGDRLCHMCSFDQAKLAAGIVLLSPFIPLLFMGEEYGETAPFLYFVNHSDPELVRAAQKGRRDFFGGEHWQGEPPDPTTEETFQRSKLNHQLGAEGKHRALREFYCQLIHLRKNVPALKQPSKEHTEVTLLEREVLALRRWHDESGACAVFNFGAQPASVYVPLPAGHWEQRLNSADECWGVEGNRDAVEPAPRTIDSPGQTRLSLAAHSFVLYVK